MKPRKKFNKVYNFLRNNQRKLVLVLVPIGIFLAVGAGLYFIAGIRTSFKFDNITEKIVLPIGFRIEIFASDLGGSLISYPGPNAGPRMMLLKDNVLFVSIPSQGRVVALLDRNNDKIAV